MFSWSRRHTYQETETTTDLKKEEIFLQKCAFFPTIPGGPSYSVRVVCFVPFLPYSCLHLPLVPSLSLHEYTLTRICTCTCTGGPFLSVRSLPRPRISPFTIARRCYVYLCMSVRASTHAGGMPQRSSHQKAMQATSAPQRDRRRVTAK